MEPLDFAKSMGISDDVDNVCDDSEQEWNETSRVGLRVLGTGIALALVADLLLRVHPWGLNVVLATLALFAGILWVRKAESQRTTGSQYVLLGLAIAFAACVAWRAALPLKVINCSAALFLIVLASSWSNIVDRRASRAGIVDFLVVGFDVMGHTALGAFYRLMPGIQWHLIPRRFKLEKSKSLVVGLALTFPLLLVFGALFAAADANFESLVRKLFSIDGNSSWLVHHTWYVVAMTWLIAGFLCTIPRSLLQRPSLQIPQASFSLGLLDVLIPLVALEAMFFLFVVLQIPHFFGGHSMIQAAGGPTYSEYARRGFFELLTVVALAIPLLLGGERLVSDEGRNKVTFRRACWPMIGLLLVVMASGFHRMSLYVGAYGLTQQRFYATAVMMTLGAITLWLGATVLSGYRERFTIGVLVCGFGCIALLNVANPDAVIAKTNLDRREANAKIDTDYIICLGPDAVPVILEKAPRLKNALQSHLYYSCIFNKQDFRTWNYGASRAAKLLTE